MVQFIWYINIYVPERKEAKRMAYLSVSSDPLQMFCGIDSKMEKTYPNSVAQTILLVALPS